MPMLLYESSAARKIPTPSLQCYQSLPWELPFSSLKFINSWLTTSKSKTLDQRSISNCYHCHLQGLQLFPVPTNPLQIPTQVWPMWSQSTKKSMSPQGHVLKPLPWTPIQPFILKWEFSDHQNKAFVRQLIHDLQHGCDIGYLRPK